MQTGVQDLDLLVGLQDRCSHIGGATHVDPEGHGLVAVATQLHVLQVQDDVGHVLHDTVDGGELVQGIVELDLRDRCARNGREQGPPERVAECVPEARLEWAYRELLTIAISVTDCFDGRSLNYQHGVSFVGVLRLAGTGYGAWPGTTWSKARL